MGLKGLFRLKIRVSKIVIQRKRNRGGGGKKKKKQTKRGRKFFAIDMH